MKSEYPAAAVVVGAKRTRSSSPSSLPTPKLSRHDDSGDDDDDDTSTDKPSSFGLHQSPPDQPSSTGPASSASHAAASVFLRPTNSSTTALSAVLPDHAPSANSAAPSSSSSTIPAPPADSMNLGSSSFNPLGHFVPDAAAASAGQASSYDYDPQSSMSTSPASQTAQAASSSVKSRTPSTTELSSALGLSSRPRERRKWNEEEDTRLRTLVAEWGDQRGKNSNWDKISESMEGRSSKDCRKRWFHSLDPTLRRGRWTPDEDRILIEAYDSLGPAWNRIAQLIPGRTDDQCSKRYNDVLDPKIKTRLREWTQDEDDLLMRLFKEEGTQWKIIASRMDGRTGLTCRNRWRKLASTSAPGGTVAAAHSAAHSAAASSSAGRIRRESSGAQDTIMTEANPLSPDSEPVSSANSTPSSVHSSVSTSAVPPPYSTSSNSQNPLSKPSQHLHKTSVTKFGNTALSSANFGSPQTQQQPSLLDRSLSMLRGSEATAFLQNVSNFAAEAEAAAAANMPLRMSSNTYTSSRPPQQQQSQAQQQMPPPQPLQSNGPTSSTTTHYTFGVDSRTGSLTQQQPGTGAASTEERQLEEQALRQKDIDSIVQAAKKMGVPVVVHQHNHHTHHNHHHYYNHGGPSSDAYANGSSTYGSPQAQSHKSSSHRPPPEPSAAATGTSPSFLNAHPEFRELEQIDMDTSDPFDWFGGAFPAHAATVTMTARGLGNSTTTGRAHGATTSPSSYEGIPFNPS